MKFSYLLAHGLYKFLKVKLQLFAYSIHGVSYFGVSKSTTCKHLAQVSQINWSFTSPPDWSGQYWCTAGSARQFPPATERGHVHSCPVRYQDAYLLCIGMTCRSPWCVLSLFSCFFVVDIRKRKKQLEDKASSPLTCEQALPPPSLPAPVPLAHRLAAFFFTEANRTTIR